MLGNLSVLMTRLLNRLGCGIYLFFHPTLWGRKLHLHGIPQILGINHLKLGENVAINGHVRLHCYGGITLEDKVVLSTGVTILTRSLVLQNYSAQIAMRCPRPHEEKPVHIGTGTWLAANVTVLPGVTIAKHCVVAAGAVVTSSLVEPNTLYAGVPARKIREI